VPTALGKQLMRQFGSDAEFWDDRQCTIQRSAGGQWSVTPVAEATNQTLVNGRALLASRALSQGDLIAVGNEAKGVTKLPLAVRGA
jgi:predicted component of type VI protein secretion system